MVQNVKHLRPELQCEGLVNWKIAMHCEVPLSCSETPQGISSQVALSERIAVHVGGRRTERSYALGTIGTPSRDCADGVIDSLAAWVLASIEIQRNARNDIRSWVREEAT